MRVGPHIALNNNGRLMKANVCKLLEHRLERDGFNVINAGRKVACPAMGRQHRFAAEFAAIRRERR